MEDIVTGLRATAYAARMSSYADKWLFTTKELRFVFTTPKNHGEFQMNALRAVALSADSDDFIVHVRWVGFEESENTRETVQQIHVDATQYLATR